MKNMMLMSCLLLSVMSATADNIQKIDASKVSNITFNGDNVTIQYNDGTPDATFDMATVTIDFSTTTSIEERMAITKKEGLEGKTIYNMKGQVVGNSAARLSKGIYIIEGKKVVIK